jgi:uncharacterized protein (DUF2236 family)
MRRTGKAAVRLGWRSLSALVAGVASIAGLGACPQPMYGVSETCTLDSDCTARFDSTWYCNHGTCAERTDGGTH